MNVNIVKIMHARNLITRNEAAEQYGCTTRTIDNKLKEIEKEIEAGRYPKEFTITKVGGIKVVNYLVLVDYMNYADRLKEKNLRKHVPPYDPVEVAKSLGWYIENVS